MTSGEFLVLLPLIVIAAGLVLVMLVVAFLRRHGAAAGLTLAVLAGAAAALPAAASGPLRVTPLLVLDRFALFYMALLIASAFAVAALSYGYLSAREAPREEFYILLLLGTLGALVMVASGHFASLFLGLEILSVSLYGLIAYPPSGRRPLEAGLKYLVLAGASSAFLLFGMALVYAELGTMELSRMASRLSSGAGGALLMPGLGMMMTGFGFKLAVVPFHLWTPDVYEGAPAPVTAFVATVSKGAAFALMLRFFVRLGTPDAGALFLTLGLIAAASMLAGNLLALLQENVKRLLAYSSIAHLGYILVAFVAGGDLAVEAVNVYFAAYFVTTLAAFGVVTVLSSGDRDADALEDYRGLFWRRPWLAGVFSVALLSLAGMPLTAGFIGKVYVIAAGVRSALWPLVLVLVAGSAVGVFYYLRLLIVMYARPSEGAPEERPRPLPSLSLAGGLVLAALLLLLVGLGVYPAPLLRAVRTAAAVLA